MNNLTHKEYLDITNTSSYNSISEPDYIYEVGIISSESMYPNSMSTKYFTIKLNAIVYWKKLIEDMEEFNTDKIIKFEEDYWYSIGSYNYVITRLPTM